MRMTALLLLACSLASADPAPWPRPLAEVYAPAAGAQRVETTGFGAWLRDLPLREPAEPVRTYQGAVVRGDFHAFDIPLVPGDLQQCADSAIRLRAEWQKAEGLPISFHSTSGDAMPWARYRAGEKAYVDGRHLAWKQAAPATWEQYLSAVFNWAGTRSLSYDTVAATAPAPGALLVLPGSPGHAMVVLDVATRGEQTLVLVGEGFMPAQDFHLVRGPEAGWWPWSLPMQVGYWTFPAEALRVWKD